MRLAALVPLLLLLGLPAAANIFGSDTRRAVPKADHPAIGIVRSATRVGTAFLIAPCQVVTNKHVAFRDVRSPNKGQRAQFLIGEGSPFSHDVWGRAVRWGDYDRTLATVAGDWAVFELEDCLGREFGTIPLRDLPIDEATRAGGQFSVAGFPADKDNYHLWRHDGCAVHGRLGRAWLTDCAGVTGLSGAPILMRRPDGQTVAIGLAAAPVRHSDAVVPVYSDDLANLMVPAGEILGYR